MGLTGPGRGALVALAISGYLGCPVSAWAISGSSGLIECQHAFSSTQAYQSPSIARVDAAAENTCVVPKADGAIDVGAATRTQGQGPTRYQYPTPPGPTDPCTETWTTGITIDPPGPARFAHWTPPTGSNLPDRISVYDAPSVENTGGRISVEEVASAAGENTASLDYVYHGYGDGIDWTCVRGAWDYTYKGPCFFGGKLTQGMTCARLQPFGQVTGTSPGPPDPAPFIKPQLAQMTRLVVAGQMGTSPADRTRQFVNLPDCWWLEGTQAHQAFQLTIDDPPSETAGAMGRGLVYSYRIDVGLQKVHWDYGDGSSMDGDVGSPYTGGGCTNSHAYSRVSTIGNPGAVPCPPTYPHPTADDGCYQVQATETYSATITASWFDGLEDHIVPMGDMAPITVSPAPEMVRVLQVEGVPVAG